MAKLCPCHAQLYQDGACPMCEAAAMPGVDWRAECVRLNEKVRRLQAALVALTTDPKESSNEAS